MKLRNVLIVVRDIDRSRKYYHDLFGLETVLDNDGNMILSEGLVLQDARSGRTFWEKTSFPKTMQANCILKNVISRALFRNWRNSIRIRTM